MNTQDLDPFIEFVVANPALILIFPLLIGVASYLLGRSHTRPMYTVPSAEVVELIAPTVEEFPEHGELIEQMLDTAVVQVLPEDTPGDATVLIVPVTRIQLNRWNKKEKKDQS